MSTKAIKDALAEMLSAARMHDGEWTYEQGDTNEWGTQCWEIHGERVQELATAYGETTAAYIAAVNPTAITGLLYRLDAAESALKKLAQRGTHHDTCPTRRLCFGNQLAEQVDTWWLTYFQEADKFVREIAAAAIGKEQSK